MDDEQHQRQRRRKREMDLAVARDRDTDYNRRRKKIKTLVCLTVTIATCHRLLQVAKARRIEAEQACRRSLYHEERARLLTAEIQRPEQSPFHHFLKSGSKRDSAWFVWTSLPYQSFMDLVDLCKPVWLDTPIEVNKGDHKYGVPRPQDITRRKLDCIFTIAMTMYFLAYPDCRVGIGSNFGMINTHVTKYVRFGLYIIIKVLQKHPNARIHWPCESQEYLDRQVQRIARMVPELRDDYGILITSWMDGFRLPIGKKKDYKEQNNDYSGEKKRHLRKVIIITDSEGYVVAAVINCPGKWGDSKCTELGGIYDLIDRKLPDGYSVGADTAFKGAVLGRKVTKILKNGEYLPDGMTEEEYNELEKLLIKSRQPGEWINRVLVQSFRRLRAGLGVFDDLNGDLMLACILLHNWRARTSSRNQVKKFFDILEKEEEVAVQNGDYSTVDIQGHVVLGGNETVEVDIDDGDDA